LAALALVNAFGGKDLHMMSFKTWMSRFNKHYTGAEMEKRFQIFKDNMAKIKILNENAKSKGKNTRYSINKFSDLTSEEFTELYKGFKKTTAPISVPIKSLPANIELPASFDWRPKGAVTDVKDQGQCGSCWAFSATEGVESAWFLAGNTLPVLAPQQIVDCDTTDQGCDGGDLPTAFAYVQQNGMESESDYPYQAQDGTCAYNSGEVVAKISGFQYATQSLNETAMQVAMIANGPLSICVDAESWQSYSNGIIESDCGTDLDHCVQIVGYASDDSNTPYWIIRNSWGTDWGISGYVYVERNQDECGVAMEATYVTIH